MEKYLNYSRKIIANSEEALSKVVGKILPGSIVLDIGCSDGMLGRYLVKEKDCVVDGVDIDLVAIERCKGIYRKVICKDFERDSFLDEFQLRSYDYIVIADIIEHLVNPEKLLSEINKLIKPDGVIIFSIPNVNHIALAIHLLLGSFNYSKNGLLDQTHLRFYTYETIVKLLQSNGLHLWEIDKVEKELNQTEFEDVWMLADDEYFINCLKNFRSDALVYQWILSFKIESCTRVAGFPPSKSSNNLTYFKDVTEYKNKVDVYKNKVDVYKKEVDEYKKAIDLILNSRSWRYTKLIRDFTKCLRSLLN
jgi:methionine biosynthesis protein MetW